jgi:hypothetical protein
MCWQAISDASPFQPLILATGMLTSRRTVVHLLACGPYHLNVVTAFAKRFCPAIGKVPAPTVDETVGERWRPPLRWAGRWTSTRRSREERITGPFSFVLPPEGGAGGKAAGHHGRRKET